MRNKPMKPIVFMRLKNSEGFTLISTLITITVILITFLFISYLFKNSTSVAQHNDISIQQFFIFMGNDIFNAENLSVEQGELLLGKNSETAVYKFYNGTVRRQLKGGQEIYLRDVSSFRAETTSYGCK